MKYIVHIKILSYNLFPIQEFAQQCLKNNEFFLYTRELEIQRWLKSRTARGLKDTMVGTFVIVNEEIFTDYDKHRQFYRRQSPNSQVIPKCELLLSWMAEEECPIEQLTEYGETYYVLSSNQFDKLATWVYRRRHDDLDSTPSPLQ